MKLGQIVTMESLDDVVGNGDEVITPLEVQEETDSLLAENEEIEQADAAIDQAEGAIEQIDESIELIKGQEEENVPLSDTQVQLLEITHESIMNNLGLQKSFPTMESLHGSNRSKTLVASLEANKETIGQKLGALMKATMQNLGVFLKGLLQSCSSLSRYADYLKKKIAALESSAKPKVQEMAASSKAMSVEGVANAKSMTKLTADALSLLNGANAAIKEVNSSSLKLDEKNIKMDMKSSDFVPSGKTRLVGGKYITEVHLGTNFNVKDILFFDISKDSQAPAKTASVLTISEMKAALDVVVKIIAEIKKVCKADNTLKRNIDTFVNFYTLGLQSYVWIASKLSDTIDKKVSPFFKMRALRALMIRLFRTFCVESFKTAKATLDYVRNSLKQYAEAGKVDKAPATS